MSRHCRCHSKPPRKNHQLEQNLVDYDASSVQKEVLTKKWEGVGVTLMWFAPKWFHRRYTFMIQNALANLPPNWAVQVVLNDPWFESDVLPYHPGLQRLLRQTTMSNATHWSYEPLPGSRLFWTPLPTKITSQPRQKVRPKDILKSTWFWEQPIAENVFYFSGNGAICANHDPAIWEELVQYDYVGTPWKKKQGGDGETHSFRRKSTMLQILSDHPPDINGKDAGPDFRYFLQHLLGSDSNYQVAPVELTHAFGGFSLDSEQAPLVISGIQAQLEHKVRENLLFVCPELKVIFPSLHEPACFGAHPDGVKCKESICALRDELPPQGC